MKKILNLCLLISSLFGLLEWGGGNQSFLFQAEWEILQKAAENPQSVLHPFTVLPMIGQLLLLITLFQKTPGKWLTYIGMGMLSLIMLMILLIGLLEMNWKMILSAMPFLVFSVMVIRNRRQ